MDMTRNVRAYMNAGIDPEEMDLVDDSYSGGEVRVGSYADQPRSRRGKNDTNKAGRTKRWSRDLSGRTILSFD